MFEDVVIISIMMMMMIIIVLMILLPLLLLIIIIIIIMIIYIITYVTEQTNISYPQCMATQLLLRAVSISSNRKKKKQIERLKS